MKFFSKYFLTDEHLNCLKDSRKRYVKNKVIDHDGNFVELVRFGKALKVNPEDDELLNMINSIERFDPVIDFLKRCQEKDFDFQMRNYDYYSLPSKLRAYMSKMDNYYLAKYINQVENGDSIEKYNAAEERLERMIPGYSEEDYIRHVILGKPFESTLGRKAKESARRSYKVVNDYIKTNIHRFTQFVTLTFALEDSKEKYEKLNAERNEGEYNIEFKFINAKDFEIAKEVYSNLIDSFKKKLKRQGIDFYFITVWELQKNGNYHFHLLCSDIPEDELYDVPEWLDYNFVTKKRNFGKGLKSWKYGKSDVQKIHSPDRVGTYVSKYIIKSFLNVNAESYQEYLNKKAYFNSRNLKKPTKSYTNDNEFEAIYNSLVDDNLVPYEKNYKNPYNDSTISNKIFTLIENKKTTSGKSSHKENVYGK